MVENAAGPFDHDAYEARMRAEHQRHIDAWNDLKSAPERIFIDGLDSPYTEETRRIAASLGATGFALNRWWVLTPTDWVCPACRRPKAEFARLTDSGLLFGDIHQHHDHMGDHVQKRFAQSAISKHWPDLTEQAVSFAKRLAPMISAYDPTLICADCNAADAKAKKIVGAPSAFSFAPADIAKFTLKARNQVHQIDHGRAVALWAELEPTFALRMKILDRMIDIALKDEHWFRSSEIQALPDFVDRQADTAIRSYNLYLETHGYPPDLVSQDRYIDLMRATRTSGTTLQTWRKHKVQALGRKATEQDGDYLAVSAHKSHWAAVPPSWRCPCCDRTKLQIIQPSNQFTISFRVEDRNGMLGGPAKAIICGECNWAVLNASKEAGVNARLVSFQDIRDCVIARPNRSHEVRSASEVDAVIERIRARH